MNMRNRSRRAANAQSGAEQLPAAARTLERQPGILAVIASLLLALLSTSAHAQTWPGVADPNLALLHVTVPADALPPGPATARIEPGATRGVQHAVRSQIRAREPASFDLWVSPSSVSKHTGQVAVVVQSESGARRTTTMDPDWEPRTWTAGTMFVGSAERMAELSATVATVGRGNAAMELTGSGMQHRAERSAPAGCLPLLAPRVVVVDAPDADNSRGWLRCAAKGANVLLVTAAPPEAIHGQAPGTMVLVGAGRVAWVPRLDGAAVAAAVALADLETAPIAHPSAVLDGGYAELTEPHIGVAPASRPIVLALLFGYAALLGGVGYWISVRQRRLWLALAWIPTLVATVSVLFGLVAARRRPAGEIVVERIALTSPDGSGLARGVVRVDGVTLAEHAVRIPWREGQLRPPGRPFRFHNPFRTTAAVVGALEDRPARTMRVEGLRTGRPQDSGLEWVEEEDGAAPRIVRRNGHLEVFNDTPRPLQRIVAIIGSTRMELGALAPGERRALLPGPSSLPSPLDDIIAVATRNGTTTSDGYLLAIEYADVRLGAESTPRLDVRSIDLHLVVGVVPGRQEAP